MSVKGMDLTEYTFVSKNDTTEPHTEFKMTPAKRMEAFSVGAVYNMIVQSESGEEKILKAFSEHANEVGDCIYGYIEKHCTSVKNFWVKDQLQSGTIDKFLDSIKPILAMEIVGDALNRVNVNEEEEKN